MRFPWAKRLNVLIAASVFAGFSYGQGLHAIGVDDFTQRNPVGVDRFLCLQDVSGRTATLPGGRAAVLSVDVNLFSAWGGAGDASERERSFERLLRHFGVILHSAGTDRAKLILFTERPHLSFGGLGERQTAALRQHELENNVLLECPESVAGRMADRVAPLPGLYLLEGGRVLYRYVRYPWYLPEDSQFERKVVDVVARDVRSFLEGEAPEHAPVSLLDLNVEVPDQLKNLVGEKAFLLLSFGGLEAEAPAKDRMIVREHEGPLGGSSAVPGFESGHPGAAGRRVIERLTPMLDKYDIAAVGLVKDSDRVEAMRRAFPGWNFVAVGTAEDFLEYWEAMNLAYFVSGGRTRHAFAITPFNLGFGEPFEKLLRDWLR